MRTYFETNMDNGYYSQLKAINWPVVIDLIEREGFESEDWETWDAAANDWVMCACGNQCAVIPRGMTGAPRDALLSSLGRDFPMLLERLASAVTGGENEHEREYCAAKVRKCLADIERRSSEILAEMKAVKNGDPA